MDLCKYKHFYHFLVYGKKSFNQAFSFLRAYSGTIVFFAFIYSQYIQALCFLVYNLKWSVTSQIENYSIVDKFGFFRINANLSQS